MKKNVQKQIAKSTSRVSKDGEKFQNTLAGKWKIFSLLLTPRQTRAPRNQPKTEQLFN